MIQNLMYCQLYDLPAGGNKKGRLRDPDYTLLSVPRFVNPRTRRPITAFTDRFSNSPGLERRSQLFRPSTSPRREISRSPPATFIDSRKK